MLLYENLLFKLDMRAEKVRIKFNIYHILMVAGLGFFFSLSNVITEF